MGGGQKKDEPVTLKPRFTKVIDQMFNVYTHSLHTFFLAIPFQVEFCQAVLKSPIIQSRPLCQIV